MSEQTIAELQAELKEVRKRDSQRYLELCDARTNLLVTEANRDYLKQEAEEWKRRYELLLEAATNKTAYQQQLLICAQIRLEGLSPVKDREREILEGQVVAWLADEAAQQRRCSPDTQPAEEK